MCGIVGVAFKEVDPALIEKMTNQMKLRGPDASGTWRSGDGAVALGHRRLSIIDLTDSGSQPMQDGSGRWCVSFNGEIYNFLELKEELESHDFTFRGTSDTEVVVNAFAHWGMEGTLQKLNGMFALAAWDSRDKKLYLARDRFGEKPLYYGNFDGAFVFASELKAVFPYPSFNKRINAEAFSHLLSYSYIPAPFSIFEGLYKLEPGRVLVVSGPEHWENKAYWDPSSEVSAALENQFTGSFEDALMETERRLLKSVRSRSISDVPLGCFLSGGIDSSLITAMMCQTSGERVSTFSIGFDHARFNEAVYAKQVADHLGTQHTELYLSDQEARDVIPGLPEIFDEPFGDSSQIPTFLVSQMARREVTVCLSGDAGDELFGGYTRYIHGPSQYNQFNRLPAVFRKIGASALQSLSPESWDTLYKIVKPMLPNRYQVLHFGEKLQKLARAVRAAGCPEAFYKRLTFQIASADHLLNQPEKFQELKLSWKPEWDVLTNMMVQDVIGYLPGDILTKVDRASMGVSLESRVPFLDPDLFRFAWSLPVGFKIHQGKGKWILRQLLKKYVPEKYFERPKSGFAIPIAEWLRGPLKTWAEDLLPLQQKDHDLINGESVKRLWQEHQTGTRNHNAVLWNLLMFRAWENRWM